MTTVLPAAAFVCTNIRSLCSSQASISEVCRHIGISRQQFNKYLSGQHVPSRRNLGRIASYFAMPEEDLYLSPGSFAKRVSARPLAVLKTLGGSRRFADFAQSAEQTLPETRAYAGVYERYHHSSIHDGMIVRSVVAIREVSGVMCHCAVERFPSTDDPRKADAVFEYRGFAFSFGGRLFMIDFETSQRNEISSTVLAPRIRTGSTLLFGLNMGIAASVAREPICSRVVLRKLPEVRLRAGLLRRAADLWPDDPSIPNDIAQYLAQDRRILSAVDPGPKVLVRRSPAPLTDSRRNGNSRKSERKPKPRSTQAK